MIEYIERFIARLRNCSRNTCGTEHVVASRDPRLGHLPGHDHTWVNGVTVTFRDPVNGYTEHFVIGCSTVRVWGDSHDDAHGYIVIDYGL